MTYTKAQRAWIWLASLEAVGVRKFDRLLEAYGSPEAVWRAYGHEMEPLLGEKAYRAMGDSHTPEYVRMLFDQMAHKDMIALTRQDPRYPPLLREIADPPAALFVRGCMELQDAHTLAIVGTRHCTAYGAAMAEQIGADLARAGVTVISGLARGIDGAAQRGAARAGGRTVAVLGSGVDRIYPPEHEKLAEEILAAGGSLVSEYGPDVQAWPQHFPARNRIISGMSAGVLLVEAGEKSGALITVDFAMEQNREVYALPGPANAGLSCAPHRLIREGARLVTCADDLLVDQRWPQDEAWMPNSPWTGTQALNAEEMRVSEALAEGEISFDALTERTELSAAQLNSVLTTLELQGIIKQLPGRIFVRG